MRQTLQTVQVTDRKTDINSETIPSHQPSIREARAHSDFEAVWRLTHDVCVAEGFTDPKADGQLRYYPELDLIPETTVFLALDPDGTLAGTCSLTVDGPQGLHADREFPEEVASIREACHARGQRLACSWRIMTRPECRSQMRVVTALIDTMVREAERQELDVILCMFSPRHARFYARTLGLRTVAGPKAMANLSSISVLMRSDLEESLSAWDGTRQRLGLAS